jgi:hypothetical protein
MHQEDGVAAAGQVAGRLAVGLAVLGHAVGAVDHHQRGVLPLALGVEPLHLDLLAAGLERLRRVGLGVGRAGRRGEGQQGGE